MLSLSFLFSMGVTNLNRCWFVMVLISTDLRFLGSSPVPKLPDFLTALQDGKAGQLSNGLLSKKGIENATPHPPSALENHVDSKLRQHAPNGNELKLLKTQETGNLLKDTTGSYAFMQLSVESQPDGDESSLKTKQSNNGLLPKLQSRQELAKQDRENSPANPQVHSQNNEHALNSVLLSHAQPDVHADLPLKNGLSMINLGHLELKLDVCTAYHFKETVRHRGCNTFTIDNKMCYGQCNSFYIPKRFLSCSYCAPSKLETLSVRLECPGQSPNFVIKRISVVKECGCKDCGLERP